MEAYPGQVTVAVGFLMCGVLVFGGVALITVAWLAFQGKLPRNRFAGVRTPATMRSDEAFDLGNRIAAPATLASGAVSLLSGVAVLVSGVGGTTGMILGVGGLIGSFSLLLAAGLLGDRAAAAMPEPETGGCGGCPGGCCG